jgi:hypothetical protein
MSLQNNRHRALAIGAQQGSGGEPNEQRVDFVAVVTDSFASNSYASEDSRCGDSRRLSREIAENIEQSKKFIAILRV